MKKLLKSHSIFFGIALIGVIIISVFAYLAKVQLQSETSPRVNVEIFYHYNHFLTNTNYFLFIVLLFIANFMFIRNRYWDTFIWTGIIFLTITLVDWIWMSELVFHYKMKNELWQGETNLAPFAGVFIALFGLSIAVVNFLVLKKIFKEKIENKSEPQLHEMPKIKK